jgi:hypothetical protein
MPDKFQEEQCGAKLYEQKTESNILVFHFCSNNKQLEIILHGFSLYVLVKVTFSKKGRILFNAGYVSDRCYCN